MSELKILCWNVNGIRAVIRKGFLDFLKKQKPDILCIQEIKISDTARHEQQFDFPGYQEFWNSAQRPGYSGTAILVKDGIKVNYLDSLSWDDEGRVQILDVGKYYLVNIYFPNANHELSRLDFKIKFSDKLLLHLKKLEKKKPLIITGDYNVAHNEIDLARPKPNVGNPGFTAEERAWMNKFLGKGFKDTFRELHPNKIQYSWWSYRANARVNNVGWRIDYFCVSNKILKKIRRAYILDKILGSDHAPVGIEIDE
ncbi:exodeoxyribonuclease III [Candidatus Parcubacteria bacterium]|mgnify:CR=1 FL=1|jgi:exodeoxyribonuclease III|nr:exodeoxyribonuclease III [Candidatus Parcubacteria bacterium]